MKEISEVREWFHEREGEMFSPEQAPFERESIVELVNDSVDPVQQVILDGERYIGVIDYREHDGWYEYTRWDDSNGKVNIGVCARCVQKAEKVSQVSRTVGDSTEKAREKFRKHYRKEHTRKPDEIETGATLLSGTTIGGNEAIHVGMDGDGSGVDTDFVLGSEVLETASFYKAVFTGKNVEPQFTTPSSSPSGVGLDSSDCVWNCNINTASIFQLDQNGSVISGFESEDIIPTGIVPDSNDSIWYADAGNDTIYLIAPEGGTLGGTGVEAQFASPSSAPYGLSLDSDNCLWNADTNSSIYRLDQSGAVGAQFTSPSSNPRGLGIDSTGCIWSSDDDANSIYRLDQNACVIARFDSPSGGTRGLGIASNDCIWNADQSSDSIYRMKLRDVVEFPQN
jgi:hypothetical protein